MLATLTQSPFSDPEWIYERKLDGERCLLFHDGGRVRLKSRNRRVLNDTYPELEEAVEEQDAAPFIADGEIVAFSRGVTSFSRLQERIGIEDRDAALRSNVAVYLYLFDLLHLGGYDLSSLPLRRRKTLLKKALRFGGRVRFTAHRNRVGESLFEAACAKGWEGIIAKRADAPYRHRRSRDWLKFKCVERQEFVVGGYTDPEGSRVGLGALLIGTYEDGNLEYAGKVGTGFTDDVLQSLSRRLASLRQRTSPFRGRTGVSNAHWVSPRLVAEVGFTEWTRGGRLRHPRFVGLRRDKKTREVTRERPEG